MPGVNDDDADELGPRQREMVYRLEERVRAMIRQLDRMEQADGEWRRSHDQAAEARFRAAEQRAERIEERLGEFVTKEQMQREFRPVNTTFGLAGNLATSLLIAALLALVGWIWQHGP